jgi:hypothetical protein
MLIYFVYISIYFSYGIFYKGKTVGKYITGTKVIMTDGNLLLYRIILYGIFPDLYLLMLSFLGKTDGTTAGAIQG